MTTTHPALPQPDGRDAHGPAAWWRLSCGSLLWAGPDGVYDPSGRAAGDLEADALAVLAACAWARSGGGAC